MAIRKKIWGAALSLLLVGGLLTGAVAHAQVATTYSSNKRTLKVGILLLDSTIDANADGTITVAEAAAGPENTDPFLFYIADETTALKPQNWEFINPLSPKIVTTDIASRWQARTAGIGPQYQVGEQVTKKMAAYWEVALTDTPLQDLLQFDLLFITNHRITKLTAADREKLRKLVDAGGILWIEDCGGMRMDPTGPFFLDQLQFSGGRGEATSGTPGPIINVPSHPILNSPNPLTPLEIANLGDKNYANYALTHIANPAQAPNPEVLVNVVGNVARGGLPYIAAGTYGAGRIIATASDSGCDINDYAGGVRTSSGGNSGAYCGENISTAHAEDLKFLYNLVAWGSANSQFRKDPRRTGSSFEAIGAPLISAFTVGVPPVGVPTDSRLSSVTAPLVAKGVVYSTGLDVATGVPSVRAYSAHPSLISGDKGIRDLVLGTPYDEIWRWSGSGNAIPSSPVLGTVFDATAVDTRAQYGDFIFVTLGDGTLVRMTALLADTVNGYILPAPLTAANPPVTSGGTYATAAGGAMPAPAPVVHDGKVYVVEPNGLVRCVNAATLETLWYSFAAAPTNLYHPNGTPTLGYSRLAITTNTGGNSRSQLAARSAGNSNDLMLYVPVWQDNPNDSSVKQMRIMAYWLGARHEVVDTDTPPASGVYRPRAAQSNRQFVALNPGYPGAAPPGYPFQRPVVRVYTNTYDGGGNLIFTAYDNMNAGRVSPNFTGRFIDATGAIQVQDSGGNPPTQSGPTPDKAIVSVDYDVYYVTPSTTPPGLTNPDTNASRPTTNILVDGFQLGAEGIAMTPEDILVSVGKHVNPRVMNAQRVATIFGDYEQSGLTRLRQALGFFEVAGGASETLMTLKNVPVAERATLRNRLIFSGPLESLTVNYGAGYEGLTNITPIGTPVTTNEGVVYQVLSAVSAVNGPVTIVAALDMKKEIVLKLPKSYNPATVVTVSQLDIAGFDPSTAGGGGTPKILTASLPPSAANAAGTLNSTSSNQNLSGDADRGRLVITDMRVNGGYFSSSLSFVVTYTPAGASQQETVVISPSALLPSTDGSEVDARDASLAENGNYSPLLWYYVLPGAPTSSVTLSGDLLYLGMTELGTGRNVLVGLDADPASNDPSVRVGMGLAVEAIFARLGASTTDQKINHIRWVQAVQAPIVGAPVGTQGTLAISTTGGTQAFENGVTLVTDAKRIAEVDASGAALWVLDGTIKPLIAGGALPTAGVGGVTVDGNGRVVLEKKTLARPSLARRLGPADYLICDTGNNRVVRVDRSGKVNWEVDELNNDFNVLHSSDPTSLNGPTDVQVYTALTPGNVGYEVHYLIADAGNNRIIEIADFYDRDNNIRMIATPAGNVRGEQQVVWVSRTTSKEGRALRFQSVQRVLTTGDPRLGQNPNLYGYPTLVVAVGNATTAGESSGGDTRTDFTGGSLASLEYYPFNTTVPLVDATGVPSATYSAWPIGGNEPQRNGLIDRTMNELVMPTTTTPPAPAGRLRRITRPTYIEQILLPNGLGGQKAAFLICDATGVYQAELGTDGRWYVTWYFDAADYKRVMNQRLIGTSDLGFLPNAVKRLPNGEYLITNAWIGQTTLFASGQFVGEVFQVSGARKFDLAGAQIDGAVLPLYAGFSAPNIFLTKDTLGNVTRREQKMGKTTSNTNLLEHPLFGDRL